MKRAYIELLAQKVGVEVNQLEKTMEKARDQASAGNERPRSEIYLEILGSKLDIKVERLRNLLVQTKQEAVDKMVSKGIISEKMAGSLKNRAQEFPFGNSYRGSQKSAERSDIGSIQRGGRRCGPSDGSGDEARPRAGIEKAFRGPSSTNLHTYKSTGKNN